MKKWILMGLGLWMLAGCSTPYPMNMSEEQWQKLTPDERKTLLVKEQAYREQQRLEQIKADARRRELEHTAAIEEKRRLENLYANPAGGNVIMVNILNGEYRYRKDLYKVLPESMLLARGETKEISLKMRDPKGYSRTERAYVQYRMDGTGVYLYLSQPGNYNDDYLAMLRDGNWACGTKSAHSFNFSQYESLNRLQVYIQEQGGNCRMSHRYR